MRYRSPRGSSSPVCTVAAMAVAVAGLAGCARGSVVVAPAVATTTTAVAGELGTDDRISIDAALRATSDLTAPFQQRLPYLEDADDLGPVSDRVAGLARSFAASVEVVDVRAGSEADSASAWVDVTVGGAVLLDDGVIPLHRTPTGWKVTRVGACTIIALVAPCPDGP